jgi:hypothetical protein
MGNTDAFLTADEQYRMNQLKSAGIDINQMAGRFWPLRI